MSIKSEHLPEEFLKIFRLYDEPDRTKKDVAYLVWCAIKEKEKQMSRVTWDEQDCGEMPLLASEKIEQLEEENKLLIEEINALRYDYKNYTPIRKYETLKESRDELLSALKVAAETEEKKGYVFNDTIQRAESLKEKENE